MIREGIHLAVSKEEKEAVYRFRYDIYVEEMGRYASTADHDNRFLVEPEDETGRITYACQDGQVVATARLSWGGDAPFSKRQVDSYMLQPFLDELPLEAMAVGERGMVRPDLRGTSVFEDLRREGSAFIEENRVQLLFGACEPHLLSLYVGEGARTYSEKNLNSPEAGYLIPIVTVVEDIEYLRRIGSPRAETTKDWGDDARIPECIDRLVKSDVLSQRLTSRGSYWAEINRELDQRAGGQLSALEGLSEEEAERCLGKSNIIQCKAGDQLLKKGGVARNMFVVLDGTLEVKDGDKLLRVLSKGDVLGEMAFLLERPRTASVYAATDDARVLSLSESTIRRMIETDPDVAARLLLNISKILCFRILKRD